MGGQTLSHLSLHNHRGWNENRQKENILTLLHEKLGKIWNGRYQHLASYNVLCMLTKQNKYLTLERHSTQLVLSVSFRPQQSDVMPAIKKNVPENHSLTSITSKVKSWLFQDMLEKNRRIKIEGMSFTI